MPQGKDDESNINPPVHKQGLRRVDRPKRPSNLNPEGSGLGEGSGAQVGLSFLPGPRRQHVCCFFSSRLCGSLQAVALPGSLIEEVKARPACQVPGPLVLAFTHSGPLLPQAEPTARAAASLTHECSYLFQAASTHPPTHHVEPPL